MWVTTYISAGFRQALEEEGRPLAGRCCETVVGGYRSSDAASHGKMGSRTWLSRCRTIDDRYRRCQREEPDLLPIDAFCPWGLSPSTLGSKLFLLVPVRPWVIAIDISPVFLVLLILGPLLGCL